METKKTEKETDEINENDLPASIIRPDSYDEEKDIEVRKEFLGLSQHVDNKMLFYNAGTNGDLSKLKEGLDKGMSISEECSASGYYWTCLHYACFYGHKEIIRYILEYEKDDTNYIPRRNIQCNKGKTPLMYVLSNVSGNENKKEILLLFHNSNAIDYNVCDKENKNIFDYIKTHLGSYLNEYYKMLIDG